MSKFFYILFFAFIFLTACKKNNDNYISQTSASNSEIQSLQLLFSSALEEGNLKSAENYALQQKNIAEQGTIKSDLGIAYENLGKVASKEQKSTIALENYLKAYSLLKAGQKAKVAMRIGNNYYQKYQYQKALIYYLKAKEDFEKEGSALENLALIYRNIGVAFENLENWQEAINYYEKSVKVLSNLNLEKDLILVYQDIAMLYIKTSNYSTALNYAQKSLSLSEKHADEAKIAKNYNNIGDIYRLQNKFALAKEWLEKSLTLKQKTGNEAALPVTYNNLGYIYLQEKNYTKAEDYLRKSEILAQEADLKEYLLETYEYLSKLYKAQNNYQLYAAYTEKYAALKEELNQSEKISFSQGLNQTLQAEQESNAFLANFELPPTSSAFPFLWIAIGLLSFAGIYFWYKMQIFKGKTENAVMMQDAYIQEKNAHIKTKDDFKAIKLLQMTNMDYENKYKELEKEHEELENNYDDLEYEKIQEGKAFKNKLLDLKNRYNILDEDIIL